MQMPTRTAGEKARIEKRIRLEKTILPVVCVLGIAAFILISALLGKTGSEANDPMPEFTPAPTEDPAFTVIKAVSAKTGASYTSGTEAYTLSYKSPADGEFGTVTTFDKQGMLCMRIRRPFAQKDAEASEDPFSQMFEPTPMPTAGAGKTEDNEAELISVANEICGFLSYVYEPESSDDVSGKIVSALKNIRSGEETKANIIYGVYLLSIEYMKADGILSVTCSPA